MEEEDQLGEGERLAACRCIDLPQGFWDEAGEPQLLAHPRGNAAGCAGRDLARDVDRIHQLSIFVDNRALDRAAARRAHHLDQLGEAV